MALVVCTHGYPAAARNFSQRPGFSEFFSAHPPGAGLPGEAQQRLLFKHRPRVFVSASQPGPIDFYRDYVANGELLAGDGSLISDDVTPELLNVHKRNPDVVLVHQPSAGPVPPAVVYGRVDDTEVRAAGRDHRLTLLTYHLVFRTSGLPAGVDGLTAAALSLLGDLQDWHQLDHYTAVTLVLDAGRRPIAMMLQQHNYTRTYAFSADTPLPPDARVEVDVAVRSNELFPHRPDPAWRRAARYASPSSMRYLMGFGPRPLMAADDFTDPATEVDYALEFLPQDDAFYVFQGYLGERRVLSGRDGPPGASFNTLPQLKPYPVQLFMGYWREQHAGDWQRYRRLVIEGGDPVGFAEAQRREFFLRLECAGQSVTRC